MASGQVEALALAAPEPVALHWEQGRLAEVAEVIAATAQQFPAATEFAALDALTRLELGRDDEGATSRRPRSAASTCRRIRSRCPRSGTGRTSPPAWAIAGRGAAGCAA